MTTTRLYASYVSEGSKKAASVRIWQLDSRCYVDLYRKYTHTPSTYLITFVWGNVYGRGCRITNTISSTLHVTMYKCAKNTGRNMSADRMLAVYS